MSSLSAVSVKVMAAKMELLISARTSRPGGGAGPRMAKMAKIRSSTSTPASMAEVRIPIAAVMR